MTAGESWRSLYPFASHFADVGGLRYHYVDEGTGSPVVLVHGNPTWSFYWRRLIADISPARRVLAPDHIGMGLSEKPDRSHYPFTLQRRIDDFAAFMDLVAPDGRVALVVHDWGGPIGIGWAVEHPDRIEHLVITNTAAFGLPADKPMPPLLSLARSPGVGGGLVMGANAFVRGTTRLGVRHRLRPDVVAGYLAPFPTRASRRAVFEFVRDIPLRPDDRSFETLAAVEAGLDRLADVPVTIIWGLGDFVFDGRILTEWERRLPHAAVHRFEDAGHLVLEDEPDAVGRIVLESLI